MEKNIAKNDSMEIDLTGMTWWDHSYPAGDPECKCSLCLELIKEDDCPVLFWTEHHVKELRLHDRCFMKRAKLISHIINIGEKNDTRP